MVCVVGVAGRAIGGQCDVSGRRCSSGRRYVS